MIWRAGYGALAALFCLLAMDAVANEWTVVAIMDACLCVVCVFGVTYREEETW